MKKACVHKNLRLQSQTALAASLLALMVLVGPGSGWTAGAREGEFVVGETAKVGAGTVTTWARVNGAGKVIWVGTTISMGVVESPPPSPGPGPSGAVVVLRYPEIARVTTYFNHFEMHWMPQGHHTPDGFLTPNRYSEPHFDFHFYSVREEGVWVIPGTMSLLPHVQPDLLPPGYVQPFISQPQMGRHSQPLSEFLAIGPLDAAMIIGFLPDASYMHFLDQMVSRTMLLRRENFSLPMPAPARLGRPTRFPSECVWYHDATADVYHVIYKGFEALQ